MGKNVGMYDVPAFSFYRYGVNRIWVQFLLRCVHFFDYISVGEYYRS